MSLAIDYKIEKDYELLKFEKENGALQRVVTCKRSAEEDCIGRVPMAMREDRAEKKSKKMD